MEMYIEAIAVQNLLLWYAVGATSYRLLRRRAERPRLWLCAMLGCAASLFYPLLPLPVWAVTALRIAVGAACALVLFAGKCAIWRGGAALLVSCLLYGGAVFALGCVKYRSVTEALHKPLSVHWWAITAAGAAILLAVRLWSTAWHRMRDRGARLYDYRVTLSCGAVRGCGFLDTGNGLYDDKTGLPVVVLACRAVLPLLSPEQTIWLWNGQADRVFIGARKLSCVGAGGTENLWLVQPENFVFCFGKDEHIVYDVMVGLSFSVPKAGAEYDAILHPALTEGVCV